MKICADVKSWIAGKENVDKVEEKLEKIYEELDKIEIVEELQELHRYIGFNDEIEKLMSKIDGLMMVEDDVDIDLDLCFQP